MNLIYYCTIISIFNKASNAISTNFCSGIFVTNYVLSKIFCHSQHLSRLIQVKGYDFQGPDITLGVSALNCMVLGAKIPLWHTFGFGPSNFQLNVNRLRQRHDLICNHWQNLPGKRWTLTKPGESQYNIWIYQTRHGAKEGQKWGQPSLNLVID